VKYIDPVLKFGETVRLLREAQSWSQDDLAGELGCDRAYISQIERGIKNPSLRTMIKLASVFAVKVTFADVFL
jgi:transcriptional regulator with XRE-family HTH domain